MHRLSFIVPTYEEPRLEEDLERLALVVASLGYEDAEVLIVDDSSPARHAAVRAWADARPRAPALPRIRVLEGPHEGKGAAVRVGAEAFVGDVVFVMDADLTIPLENIASFLARLTATQADIVIGERPLGRNAGDPVRFVLSRGLYAFQRFVMFQRPAFRDTQCGFKAFRGEVLRQLAARQVVAGGMYDIEYLYLADRAGLRVERVPVVPGEEVRPSTINVGRAMLSDPRDLLRVKWRGLSGRYPPLR